MYRQIAVFSAGLLGCASGVAATDWMPSDRTIVRIDTFDGKVLVHFELAFQNTQGCSKADQDEAIIRTGGGTTIPCFTSLLAAATAGNRVGISLNGCGGGSYDYPVAYRARVEC